jgi:hypothetical protein
MAGHDQLLELYREFIREQTLRFERAMRSLVAELREELGMLREEFGMLREEFGMQREESRQYFEALVAASERENRRIDDLVEESRAQRRALLHILDRLDNGGTAPAA